MRIQTYFNNELYFPNSLRKGDKNKHVKKLQEFLILENMEFNFNNTIDLIHDGDFGNKTLNFLVSYQNFKNLAPNGVADKQVFSNLTKKFENAFSEIPQSENFDEVILSIANNHLNNKSAELFTGSIPNHNKGPWVRAYCNGSDYPNDIIGPRWCAGFIKSILDMACTNQIFDYKKFMPNTLSCDDIADFASNKNLLKRYEKLFDFESNVKPGDIFLIFSTKNNNERYVHTGFVEKLIGNGKFISIEGNAGENYGFGLKVVKKTIHFAQEYVFTYPKNNLEYKHFYVFYHVNKLF